MKSVIKCRRAAALLAMACALGLMSTSPSPAQTVDEAPQPKSVGEPLPLEAFQPARMKRYIKPAYPSDARAKNEEGWVKLSFMVSPEGKAYEFYISQSVGNKEFERSALEIIKYWTFEPAVLKGQPIDSANCIKLKFTLNGGLSGATREFFDSYRALSKAIDDNDKVAAEAAKAKLHISNLYEDAYFGIAEYKYASRWGDQAQQMAGLERAIAEEASAHYLPKPLFASALQAMLPLEINANNFADAMDIWESLQSAGIDQRKLAGFKPMIEQIETLRTNDQAYAVSGQIVESSWSFMLFKNRFQLAVSEGHISDVKLLCSKKFVVFKFDPDLEYRVSDKFGKCRIAIAGDPGTKFKLIQH
jgi:TonB family protein